MELNTQQEIWYVPHGVFLRRVGDAALASFTLSHGRPALQVMQDLGYRSRSPFEALGNVEVRGSSNEWRLSTVQFQLLELIDRERRLDITWEAAVGDAFVALSTYYREESNRRAQGRVNWSRVWR